MRQVLINIGLPIYGYGFMLMVAFLVGMWLAVRRARAEGISKDHLWDICFPIFLGGLVGGRLLSRIMDPSPGNWWQQILGFFEIWRGGLILYGGVPGGLLGYVYAYYRVVRPNKLSTLRIADIVAPSLALGLFFGRIGCFMNGCCWGDVADPASAAWVERLGDLTRFPAHSPPHRTAVLHGYQTAYGFTVHDLETRTVREVEAFSPAWDAGLRQGDVITKIESSETPGEPLQLTIRREAQTLELTFTPPRSLPLLPTQLLSALDGVVLFILLTAFYPFRRRAGEVVALLMLWYAVNRFFIEQLRMDNPPEWFGMTLSQNISILMFLGGLVLCWWVRRQNVPVS
jgi:phosphatidylglycerol:prolipoprotein diacylglycerol transferase